MGKLFRTVALASILAVAAVAALEAQALSLSPGMTGAAEFDTGIYLQGSIKSVGTASVDFIAKDGRKKTLAPAKVLPFSPSNVFKAGERVLGNFEGDVMLYEAVVKKVGAGSYTVSWVTDDGSESLAELKASDMVRISDFGKAKIAAAQPSGKPAQPAQGAAETSPLAEGDVVAALFNEGNWYKGEVAGTDGPRYIINTPEGRQSYLTRDRLKALGGSPKLSVGQRVAALYGSEKFYGAIVQSVENGGAVLKWIDGTKPSFVDGGKIITGVGDYEYKPVVSDDPKDLITFTFNSADYAYNRRNGRVLVKGGLAGTYDAAKGSLDALSSYNANGIIDSGGGINLWLAGTQYSGRLDKDGTLTVGGKKIVTISDSAFGGAKLGWDERRAIALIIAVYALR